MKKPTRAALTALAMTLCACGGNDGGDGPFPTDPPPAGAFNIDDIVDAYAPLLSRPAEWGPYNVHDPSIIKADDGYWYSYSTDAAYGFAFDVGIQVRRSRDLIEWQYVGVAFDGFPALGEAHIRDHGGVPVNGLWAPYISRHGDEYRLYYSLSSPTPRLSAIGLATSTSPLGPWTERGLAVTSLDNSERQTNAIDPTVVTTPAGEQWFYYGSAWDGIYVLKLDPATGLAATAGDKGVRVAQRGFTRNQTSGLWSINGNIEGPEIVYNETFGKYYLFIAYDWLSTKYNIRVGRSDSPQGPFLDFNGNDLNLDQDDGPMIVAPYKFTGHDGWQGTAHNSTFKDDAGQWYLAHQGRPSIDPAFMVLHVRKLHWTDDGWPIASPERYAGVAQTPIAESELIGRWDQIVLGYSVMPGYEAEQTSPDLQVAFPLQLGAGGVINGDAGSHWSYDAPWLTLAFSNGFTDRVRVERERDWENKVASTLVFTGLNNGGTAIWGKKLGE